VSQAEKHIQARPRGQPFDFTAMSAISNVYRAVTAVRNHMERTVLAEYDLRWAGLHGPVGAVDLVRPRGRSRR
jgi:hypothetical protein